MPLTLRGFKLRCLLSLSLVYSCVPQQQLLPQPTARPSSSPSSPLPSTSPSTSLPSPSVLPSVEATALPQLNKTEVNQLRQSGLVEAHNAFAWDLFSAIDQANPQASHFISPLSASLALQMVLSGARGETFTEIQKALHLDSQSSEDLLPLTTLLMRKLHRPASDVTLELANAFWADQNTTFLPDFQKTLQTVFEADTFSVDLQDLKTNARINQWTAEKTHQAIPQILPPDQVLAPDVVALLMNAVYFKGDWTQPFEAVETEKKPFYLENGNVVDVEMMRQWGRYRYLAPREHFPHQGLALPYGQEGKVTMYLFLPTTGQSLHDLKADLQQVGFESLQFHFYTEGGSIQVPRFRMRQTINMIPALEALGVKHLFNEAQADLSGMVEEPRLFVNRVEQFTYIEVKEEGTEAAAVTDIGLVEPSSEPLKTLDMRVDHPFFFLIRDEETGQILFMGSVTDPR